MGIKGTRVRSINRVLKLTNGLTKIRFVCPIVGDNKFMWTKVGFEDELKLGDSLMPSYLGPITDYNVQGKEIVRDDLPKEPRSYHSFREWKDWHGRWHSGTQTRTIDVYPRDYMSAPSEKIFSLALSEKRYLSTREINLSLEKDESVIHLAKLMLECFGEFEIVDSNSGLSALPKFRELNWEVLPKGQYPWERVEFYIKSKTENMSKSDRGVIEDRIKWITRFTPEFMAMGRGGFSGYFVYGFDSKQLYVLESNRLGNATYVFGKDWEELSQMTKNEIINGKNYYERVIHDHSWRANISRCLG